MSFNSLKIDELLEKVEDLEYDLEEAKRLKDKGKALAASRREGDLRIAQDLAKLLAVRYKTVSADDVQRQLAKRGIDLGNAAGSIFKPKADWEWTGDWVQSTRKSNHARYIRVWKRSEPKDQWI